MGLFDRKKTSYFDSQPLYTVGNGKNLLVVGLGNIGVEYAQTRHNIGFMAIDRYKESHDFDGWIEKKDLLCYQSTGMIGNTRVILIKPITMMNSSGEAVQKVQHFYKISESDTLVIHDELDIDFGTIRTRAGGSSAGHNGVKSLLEHLDEGFGRIRVGIGPKTPAKIDSADFVLKKFNDEQSALLPKILREVCALIDERTAGKLPQQTSTVG